MSTSSGKGATTVAVTGATGTVGRPLVAALVAGGATVRAVVRESGTAPPGAEEYVGELTDRDALRTAFAGADAIYLLTPVSPDSTRMQTIAIDTAAALGGPRLVLHGAAGMAAPAHGVRFLEGHAAAADHLRASGLAWTVLAPNGFMQNTLGMRDAVAAGTLASSVGDSAVSFVDVRDVAAAAAHVLTTDGHDRRTYVLTGPEPLSYHDLAQQLAAAVGHPVRYRPLDAAQQLDALLSAGADRWAAEGMVELNRYYAGGHAAAVSPDLGQLLGRTPRSFADFLTDHRSLFR